MEFCTNLEQSKILGRILPLSSADMGWNLFFDDTKRVLPIDDWALTKDGSGGVKFYHAWSLTALLRIIKNCNLGYIMQTTYGNNVIIVCEMGEKPYTITTNEYDNEVDACVEMIVKLHEQNLL